MIIPADICNTTAELLAPVVSQRKHRFENLPDCGVRFDDKTEECVVLDFRDSGKRETVVSLLHAGALRANKALERFQQLYDKVDADVDFEV